eukprot:6206939-Amphidinium_carterae.1
MYFCYPCEVSRKHKNVVCHSVWSVKLSNSCVSEGLVPKEFWSWWVAMKQHNVLSSISSARGQWTNCKSYAVLFHPAVQLLCPLSLRLITRHVHQVLTPII